MEVMTLEKFVELGTVQRINYTEQIINKNPYEFILAIMGDGFNKDIIDECEEIQDVWYDLYKDINEWGEPFNCADICENVTSVYLLNRHFGYYCKKNQLLPIVEDCNHNLYWIRRTGGQLYYQDGEFQKAVIQYMNSVNV